MKILSQVVNKIFRLNPNVAYDAKTMKSAQNYLTDLVIRELNGGRNVNLEAVFEMVKEKLEAINEDKKKRI